LPDADAMLNAGKDLAAVLQALEVSEATLHCWRAQYGGLKSCPVGCRLPNLSSDRQQFRWKRFASWTIGCRGERRVKRSSCHVDCAKDKL
jgi:hypothetical protein